MFINISGTNSPVIVNINQINCIKHSCDFFDNMETILYYVRKESGTGEFVDFETFGDIKDLKIRYNEIVNFLKKNGRIV